MSPVVDCSTEDALSEGVRQAAEAVRAGQVVVLPTDTVYGVGCDAFSVEAVQALLAAKGRGREMPPPVLIPQARTVDGLADQVPAYARDLIERYWPGPLTLVFLAQPSLMWDLGDTNGTVALRMPDHPITRAVLEEVGPMAVTSANLTGAAAATTVLDAATQLGSSVSVYLDGGPSGEAIPSTIVDCTGEEPVILREGAVPAAEILALVDEAAPADPGDQGIDVTGTHGTDPRPGGATAPGGGTDPGSDEVPPHR